MNTVYYTRPAHLRRGERGTVDPALEADIRAQLEHNRERTGPPPDAVAVPPIPHGRYRDEALFALEQDRVWRRTLAVRGPRVRARRAGGLRDLRAVGCAARGGPGRRRGDPGLLQQLSPSRGARRAGRVRDGPAPDLPVPLVVLRPRRRPEGGSRRPQLRRPRPGCPRARAGAVRDVGGVGLRERGPRRAGRSWTSSARSATR